MRKTIGILILSAILFAGCSKDDLSFEGSNWISHNGEYVNELYFESSTFEMVVLLSGNNEIISSVLGSYSVSDGVATMVFDSKALALHEAEISGGDLILTNTSTNKSFKYIRK